MSNADLISMAQNGYQGTIKLEDNNFFKADDFPFYCVVGILKSDKKIVLDGKLPVLNLAIMSIDDMPITQFRGTARAIYKHISGCGFSREHLAYIGFELGKAEACALTNATYTQS